MQIKLTKITYFKIDIAVQVQDSDVYGILRDEK